MIYRRLGLLSALFWLGFSKVGFGSPKVSNFGKERIANQFIVKFSQGVDAPKALSMLKARGGKILHRFRASGAFLVEYQADSATTENIAHRLSQAPEVEYIEANVILHMDKTPNDPKFSDLYGLNNTGAQGGRAGADIKAVKAWDVGTGSRNVLVGVIDTGIDYSHPDIKANAWTNPGESGTDSEGRDKATNGIDDDGNGYVDDVRGWNFVDENNDPSDDNGHGTHCAGTIGASGDDGFGVVGVNWQVSLVAAKFLDASGSGTLDAAVKAIEYTTKLGVTLSSNSWGGGGFSDTMDAAIREAEEKNILFIAAAGNDSSDNDQDPHYPSSYESDNIIAVAATDRLDRMANFSSYGATSVDVGAPGVGILSTVPGGGFERLSGTSMATPHVSGVAALIKSVYPEATAKEIKARILNTVDPVAALSGKTLTGGRVNAFHALESDSVPPGHVVDVMVSNPGLSTLQLSFVGTGDDGEEGAASRYEVRVAASPILCEEDWGKAQRVASKRLEASDDGREKLEVSGLSYGSEGYLAVRAMDNVGNRGQISASFPYQVLKTQTIYENTAETTEGVTMEAPWGVEAVQGRGNVFSDSPEGAYESDTNASLTLPTMDVTSPSMLLVFDTAFELEEGYDFGAVEVSTDGGQSWKTAAAYTGEGEWSTKSVELTSLLQSAKTLTVRFRLKADGTVSGNGWLLDNIKILSAKF